MDNSTWAYSLDGTRAAIFSDGVIPDGWTADIMVVPEERRTAEALSALVERDPEPIPAARKPRKG